MSRKFINFFTSVIVSASIIVTFSMVVSASVESDLVDSTTIESIAPPTVTTYSYGYKSVLKDTVRYEGDNSTVHNRITLFGILNPNGYTEFKYGILFKKADAMYESIATSGMVVGAPGVAKYPAQSPYILPYYLYGVSLYGSNLNEGMFYLRPYVEYTVGSETMYSYGNVVNTVLLNPQPVVETSNISANTTPLTNTETTSTDNTSINENASVDTTTATNTTTTDNTTSTDVSNNTTTPVAEAVEGGVQ